MEKSELELVKEEIIPTEVVESAVPLTSIERSICELYANARTKKEISTLLGIPMNSVTKTLKKRGIDTFINDLILAQNMAQKAGRVRVLSRIADDMIEKIEEGEGSFADATKKDLVDIIKTIDDIMKEKEKADLGTNKDNTYIQILNGMMDNG